MPFQFEEDTYNLKKYWATVLTEGDFSSGYVRRVTLKIGIPRSPLKPSYLPTIRFGKST